MANGTQSSIATKKWLFVSHESLSGDIGWALKREGHEVKVYIKREADRDVYDGILEKVDDWRKFVDWSDVVVFDDIAFGKEADELRAKGKLVIGGSSYTDRLEIDRAFGQAEMERLGMNVLPQWSFTKFDEAIEFITKNPDRYVFKPSKFAAEEQKELLFIGSEEDGKDLIEVLAHNKKEWGKKILSFQLQKFASGVEIGVGAFFNGDDFIYPINVNFEHKRLFPGEVGPFTGEMGTLMYWSEPNDIFNATLVKMLPDLKKSGYVGYIDLNCIVNGKGIYPLEFTSRFGYPTMSIQMEGITMSIGEFFWKMVTKEPFALKVKRGFQVGVVVAIPPFPFYDDDIARIYRDSSIIFRGFNGDLDGVHLGDVKFIEGDWHVAGDSGYVLVITGSGTTVEQARKQTYQRVYNVILLNKFYRTDIGLRWYQDSDKLQTWGYIH